MTSTILLPPRAQLCIRYCSNKQQLGQARHRSLCGLVCPSRTNERGGEGYCVKEGEGEEGERERERAGEVRLYYSLGY